VAGPESSIIFDTRRVLEKRTVWKKVFKVCGKPKIDLRKTNIKR
jgi:hypothetical protein